MKNKALVSILAAATVAAVPAIAAADRGSRARLINLGEVDTHANDAEDFVTVSPARHLDSIVLQAHDGVVPIDEVKIQYTDGRIYYPRARGVLRPGERMTIDVPNSALPIKMLVIDYGERSRRVERRGRANAKVEVVAYAEPRRQRYDRYDRSRYDRRPYDDGQARFEWRGGIRLRVP